MILFGIATDRGNEFFGSRQSRVIVEVGFGDMLADMVFDDLIEQAVDRPARRGDEMQGLGAILPGFNRPLDRLNLPRDPANAHEKRLALR